MSEPKRSVTLQLNEADCLWLEKMVGAAWIQRMEQHIEHEVAMRRTFGEEVLKMRPPWDY